MHLIEAHPVPTPADAERLVADLWQVGGGRPIGLYTMAIGGRVMLGVHSSHRGLDESCASTIADQCGGAVEGGWMVPQILNSAREVAAANLVPTVNNHGCKMVLPGIGDPETSEVVAKMIGRTEYTDLQLSHQSGSTSRSYSIRQDQMASPDALRQLQEGTAIVLYRGRPPTIVRLRPWYAERRLTAMVEGTPERETAVDRRSAGEPP
jgi:hypothetical protein